MAFKDLKALGGTPEFQEMMKKLLAEQDAEKTQDAAETPVADKKETDVDGKTVAKIEEDLKNQKREIISLVNSMWGKRDAESKKDKKSTQVSLTKISSRLTAIDNKLTRILTSITNIGKTISKSYDLQKERFDNYELDKAKRVDDTKETSGGGKEYTAVKSVDSGGLLKYLPFLLMAGAFLTGFISKWLEGKKNQLSELFAPITAIFLKNGIFGKLTDSMISGIGKSLNLFVKGINGATSLLKGTLTNLTNRLLAATGRKIAPPVIPATNTPSLSNRAPAAGSGSPGGTISAVNEASLAAGKEPVLPSGMSINDKGKLVMSTIDKKTGRVVSNMVPKNLADPILAEFKAKMSVYNIAQTTLAAQAEKIAAATANESGPFKTPKEVKAALRTMGNFVRRHDYSATFTKKSIATREAFMNTNPKLLKYLGYLKYFKQGLLISGIGAGSYGGYALSKEYLGEQYGWIGAVSAGAITFTGFAAAMLLIKKVKGASVAALKALSAISILSDAIIGAYKYYTSGVDKTTRDISLLERGFVQSLGSFLGILIIAAAGAKVGAVIGTEIGATLGGIINGFLYRSPAAVAAGALSGGLTGKKVGEWLGTIAAAGTGAAFGRYLAELIFRVARGETTSEEARMELVGKMFGAESASESKRISKNQEFAYNVGNFAVQSATGVFADLGMPGVTRALGAAGGGLLSLGVGIVGKAVIATENMLGSGKNVSNMLSSPPAPPSAPTPPAPPSAPTPAGSGQLPLILRTPASNQQQPTQSGFPYLSAFKLPTAVDNITVSSATP